MNGDAVEVVHPERTRKARRVGGPGRLWPGSIRIEHGMVDHQLTASVEHVSQRDVSMLALEGVLLVHQLPGKISAFATQLIAEMGELLFFGEVLFASRHPLVVRNHIVSHHWSRSF